MKALLDVLPLPQSIIQEAYESYNRMTINLDVILTLIAVKFGNNRIKYVTIGHV